MSVCPSNPSITFPPLFLVFFYLIKFLVMFFNFGLIFNPDFHPQSLVLTDLTQTLSGRVGGVVLTVLLFPGLNKSSEDTALLSIGSQISPSTHPAGSGKVSQPGMIGGRQS